MGINVNDKPVSASAAVIAAASENNEKNSAPKKPLVLVQTVTPEEKAALLAQYGAAPAIAALNAVPKAKTPAPKIDLAMATINFDGIEKQLQSKINTGDVECDKKIIARIIQAIMEMLRKAKRFLFGGKGDAGSNGSEMPVEQVSENIFVGEKTAVQNIADQMNGLVDSFIPSSLEKLEPEALGISFQSTMNAKAKLLLYSQAHFQDATSLLNSKWIPIAADMGLKEEMSPQQIGHLLKNVSPNFLEKIDGNGEIRQLTQLLPQLQSRMTAHLNNLTTTIHAFAENGATVGGVNAAFIEKVVHTNGLTLKGIAAFANKLQSSIAVDALRSASNAAKEGDPEAYSASGMDAMLRDMIPAAAEKADDTKVEREIPPPQAIVDGDSNEHDTDQDQHMGTGPSIS